MNETIHEFTTQLKFSHDQSDAPYWREVYEQAFPDMVAMEDLRTHGWSQHAGRDRAIVLSTGRTLYVDEKVRRNDYGDFCIEVWSVYPLNGTAPYNRMPGAVEGWAVAPKDCDYLAYAFAPSQTCYLFPYFSLRPAWEKHGGMWRSKAQLDEDGYRWVVAHNERYLTVSIAVPKRAFYACIQDAQTITWTRTAA